MQHPKFHVCEMWTELCTNGGEAVDEPRNSGGNKKVSGITMCLSENPLTLDSNGSLLEDVTKSARQPGR